MAGQIRISTVSRGQSIYMYVIIDEGGFCLYQEGIYGKYVREMLETPTAHKDGR